MTDIRPSPEMPGPRSLKRIERIPLSYEVHRRIFLGVEDLRPPDWREDPEGAEWVRLSAVRRVIDAADPREEPIVSIMQEGSPRDRQAARMQRGTPEQRSSAESIAPQEWNR